MASPVHEARRLSGVGRSALSTFMVPQRGHLMARRLYSPMPSLRLQLPQRMSCTDVVVQRCARIPAPREVARPWPNWQALSAGAGRCRCSNTCHVAASFFPSPAQRRRAPCEAPHSCSAAAIQVAALHSRLTSECHARGQSTCAARCARCAYNTNAGACGPSGRRLVVIGQAGRLDLQIERSGIAAVGQMVRDLGEDPRGIVDLRLPATHGRRQLRE